MDTIEIEQEEWYKALVEDCKAIITERVYNSRMELIVGYAEVGQRIYNDPNYQKYGKGNQEFLRRLFTRIGLSMYTGYNCLKFYEKFLKDKVVSDISETILDVLPEGKNISWTKLVTKYLPDRKQEECQHEPLVICKKCRKTLDDFEVRRKTEE